MAKLLKTHRKIDMPVPVGGKEIHMNNDLNGASGVAGRPVCILQDSQISHNLKDCGIGEQESKAHARDMRHCLRVAL